MDTKTSVGMVPISGSFDSVSCFQALLTTQIRKFFSRCPDLDGEPEVGADDQEGREDFRYGERVALCTEKKGSGRTVRSAYADTESHAEGEEGY